jgi:hypothetical protein
MGSLDYAAFVNIGKCALLQGNSILEGEATVRSIAQAVVCADFEVAEEGFLRECMVHAAEALPVIVKSEMKTRRVVCSQGRIEPMPMNMIGPVAEV